MNCKRTVFDSVIVEEHCFAFSFINSNRAAVFEVKFNVAVFVDFSTFNCEFACIDLVCTGVIAACRFSTEVESFDSVVSVCRSNRYNCTVLSVAAVFRSSKFNGIVACSCVNNIARACKYSIVTFAAFERACVIKLFVSRSFCIVVTNEYCAVFNVAHIEFAAAAVSESYFGRFAVAACSVNVFLIVEVSFCTACGVFVAACRFRIKYNCACTVNRSFAVFKVK